MSLPVKSDSRSRIQRLLACIVAVWIALMLFVQWLVFMPQSVLAVETVTKLPMVNFRAALLSQLSKPLGSK